MCVCPDEGFLQGPKTSTYVSCYEFAQIKKKSTRFCAGVFIKFEISEYLVPSASVTANTVIVDEGSAVWTEN